MLSRLVAAFSLLAGTTTVLGHTSGSYWVNYPGDAPADCVVEDGELVDDSCCTGAANPFPIRPTFASTCFVISGFLGDNGGSLMSYLGCDAIDSGVEPHYGESCYNMGENGGLIPPNVTVPDTNASTIKECGCTFKVVGNGCHKIRDFSSLPGFENDTRQVFLFMNETCHDDPPTTMPPSVSAMKALHYLLVAVMVTATSYLLQ